MTFIKYNICCILLVFSIAVMAQAPDWNVNGGDYDHNMRITLNLDLYCGGAAPAGPYTIAVFIDGVLSGVTSATTGSDGFVTVYSNNPIGGVISYQVYDADDNEVTDYNSGLTFQADQRGVSDAIGDAGGNADGDAYCDSEDPCPNTPNTVLSDRDGDGIDDACDAYPDEDNRNDSDGDGIPDMADDDDCGCTTPDDIIVVCKDGVQVSVKCIELINPLVVCGTCPPVNNCKNRPCEDGDPCTTGETYNRDCTICSGGVYRDTDNDGVCDGLDQCPGKDDSRDFDNDGTPDGCDVDPACDTCQPDIDGNITICQVFTNGNMSSYKGSCYDLKTIFDSDGNFLKEGSHCGPCTCASIGDVDSDGDGVCDSKDECPDNPNLKKMGNCSCEDEDDNGDGIADSCDRSICDNSGDTEHEWIESIMIDNQSLTEQSNEGFIYHDENNAIFSHRNQTVTFSITPTCLGMDCHLSYAIYADWNGDKDFDDEGEIVALHRGGNGFSGEFIIPSFAVSHSILRVIVDYGRITGPCDDHIEGEVEDLMISFEEDCDIKSESFMYDEDTALNGQGNSTDWNTLWVQDESSLGLSQILSQSLNHPDINSNEQKLGILNIANSVHSISRDLTLSYPSIINFLYMKSGGQGTFKFHLADESVSIEINENGQVSLNGVIGNEIIEVNKVYRFVVNIDKGQNEQASISMIYSFDSFDEESTVVTTSSDIPSQQNKLIITTQNSDNFLPIAQYLDEIRISCSEDKISNLKAKVKSKKRDVPSKSLDLDVQVFPNPVMDQNLTVQIDNQMFFNGELQLIGMDGSKVLNRPIFSGYDTIKTDHLHKGVYLLIIRSSSQLIQKTVVVQ